MNIKPFSTARTRVLTPIDLLLLLLPLLLLSFFCSAPVFAQTRTATTLVSSLNPSAVGSDVTATAVVTPIVPDGEYVEFYEGGIEIGAATTVGSTAALTASPPVAGTYSVTAVYGGDGYYLPSTSNAVLQSVETTSKTVSTVTLASSLNPVTAGTKVSVTATVNPTVPSGEPVTFYANGNVLLGQVKTSNGIATLTAVAPAFGIYTITAVYAGDADYTSSTSTSLIQVVEATNPAPTHVAIALGDSLAFGSETPALTGRSYGVQGYVAPVAQWLTGLLDGVAPTVINLSIPAETSSTFYSGHSASFDNLNLNYTSPSKQTQYGMLHQMVSTEYAKGNTIGAVTLQLGGDDLLNLMDNSTFENDPPSVQVALAEAALNTASGNIAALAGSTLSELPGTKVFIVGYYDPLSDSPSNPLDQISKPAIAALNVMLQQLAAESGQVYVDIAPLFVGHINQYTYMSSLGFPAGLHCNPTGYGVIAKAIEQASGL